MKSEKNGTIPVENKIGKCGKFLSITCSKGENNWMPGQGRKFSIHRKCRFLVKLRKERRSSKNVGKYRKSAERKITNKGHNHAVQLILCSLYYCSVIYHLVLTPSYWLHTVFTVPATNNGTWHYSTQFLCSFVRLSLIQEHLFLSLPRSRYSSYWPKFVISSKNRCIEHVCCEN